MICDVIIMRPFTQDSNGVLLANVRGETFTGLSLICTLSSISSDSLIGSTKSCPRKVKESADTQWREEGIDDNQERGGK